MRAGDEVRLILEFLDHDNGSILRLDPEFRNDGSQSRCRMGMIEGELVTIAPQHYRNREPTEAQKRWSKYLSPRANSPTRHDSPEWSRTRANYALGRQCNPSCHLIEHFPMPGNTLTQNIDSRNPVRVTGLAKKCL